MVPVMAQEKTFEDMLGGHKHRTLSTSFPAVWEPKRSGECIKAEYIESVEIAPRGVKMLTHNLSLLDFNATFVRNKTAYLPALQEIISVSGQRLDVLKSLRPGQKVVIRYDGVGEKTGAKNAPKLFVIEVIE